MLPVKFLENRALITLNAKFYDIYPVTEACEKFKDICKIKVLHFKNEKRIEIEIEPKIETNLEELVLDFSNWILHIQAKGV